MDHSVFDPPEGPGQAGTIVPVRKLAWGGRGVVPAERKPVSRAGKVEWRTDSAGFVTGTIS